MLAWGMCFQQYEARRSLGVRMYWLGVVRGIGAHVLVHMYWLGVVQGIARGALLFASCACWSVHHLPPCGQPEGPGLLSTAARMCTRCGHGASTGHLVWMVWVMQHIAASGALHATCSPPPTNSFAEESQALACCQQACPPTRAAHHTRPQTLDAHAEVLPQLVSLEDQSPLVHLILSRTATGSSARCLGAP